MAKPEQIPTDLTLSLGEELAPEVFMIAIKNFFGFVSEIANSQAGDGSEISWIVKVREGSSLIGLEPAPTASPSRLAMIYEKVRYAPLAIARGDVRGSGLSERAIGYLRNLSELASKNGNGENVNIWVRREQVAISAAISKNVALERQSDYYDRGTIEGRLETIADANGGIRINIKDYLYASAIRCVVPERLLQLVLNNLLDNAWKHTGKREEAVIEFGMADVEGITACFVRDNGAGFNMAYADRLFKPFRPLPGTEEFATDGIGLATVERIIRRHGGKVWAEGAPDTGATFWFTVQGEELHNR